jgi:hypothetical protein
VRILEGRRSRLEERREGFRSSITRTRSRLDRYTLQLQEHGLESVEREVRWLTELIETEREAHPPVRPVRRLPAADAAAPPPDPSPDRQPDR